MIDGDGHARLTGLDLVTMASDRSTMSSPQRPGGAFAWMSPELLHPERFGLKKPHPTTESDCYALGMVIYEVLSGRAPFYNRPGPEVVLLVLRGERPEKLRGNETNVFTDKIWEILELCWRDRPSDRPSVRGVLIGLGGDLSPSEQPPDVDGDTLENGPGMLFPPYFTFVPHHSQTPAGPSFTGIDGERGAPQQVANPRGRLVCVLRCGLKELLAALDRCRCFPSS